MDVFHSWGIEFVFHDKFIILSRKLMTLSGACIKKVKGMSSHPGVEFKLHFLRMVVSSVFLKSSLILLLSIIISLVKVLEVRCEVINLLIVIVLFANKSGFKLLSELMASKFLGNLSVESESDITRLFLSFRKNVELACFL